MNNPEIKDILPDEVARLRRELIALARDIACGTAGKITAIRAYRSGTGLSLRESKDWVEQFVRPKPVEPEFATVFRLQLLEQRVAALETWKKA